MRLREVKNKTILIKVISHQKGYDPISYGMCDEMA